jgi:hypothetical protein
MLYPWRWFQIFPFNNYEPVISVSYVLQLKSPYSFQLRLVLVLFFSFSFSLEFDRITSLPLVWSAGNMASLSFLFLFPLCLHQVLPYCVTSFHASSLMSRKHCLFFQFFSLFASSLEFDCKCPCFTAQRLFVPLVWWAGTLSFFLLWIFFISYFPRKKLLILAFLIPVSSLL